MGDERNWGGFDCWENVGIGGEGVGGFEQHQSQGPFSSGLMMMMTLLLVMIRLDEVSIQGKQHLVALILW